VQQLLDIVVAIWYHYLVVPINYHTDWRTFPDD